MGSYNYQPVSGQLPGASFERQTRAFLEDAATRAVWSNVEGKPDLESWQAEVGGRLSELDGRVIANGQEVQNALSGMKANAAAILALREGVSAGQTSSAALRTRMDALEQNDAALENRVVIQEQTAAAHQAHIAALQARTADNEAALTAAGSIHAMAVTAQTEIDAAKSRGQIGEFAAPAVGTQDLNALTEPGVHSVVQTGQRNGPGLGAGTVYVSKRLGTNLSQLYMEDNHDPARMAYRAQKSGAWTPWRRILTTDGADSLTPATIGAAPAARGVPVGLVGLWNGATPPTGWMVCNGANGTPNLSGYVTGSLRFIQFKG